MRLKIGTRRSKLALAQTELVCRALQAQFPRLETEIVEIATQGDRIPEKPLMTFDGKGIFVSEIEQALQRGDIDLAVHSAKDLPLQLADGLIIPAVLKRGNPADVLVLRKGEIMRDTTDCCIGTGSLRRRMFLKKWYPHVQPADIRGNVDTRIQKLCDGKYDGIILAAAGLERLSVQREDIHLCPFSPECFLPAPCQGIIAIESRKENAPFLEPLNDPKTYTEFETERYVLKKVGGGCKTPLGGYAHVECSQISLYIAVVADKILHCKGDIAERFHMVERLVRQL